MALGHAEGTLSVSGLLANDRFAKQQTTDVPALLERLGISDGKKPIIYTTSPLRNRRAVHNKRDSSYRHKVLAQIDLAAQRTGRRVIVKLHPNEELERERELIFQAIPDAIVTGRELAMDELFPITGVLVNRGNSQTCLEAVLRGIPTVVAANGLKTLFHEDGGAFVVDDSDDLAAVIEKALTGAPPAADKIRAKHFFRPPESVAAFIARGLSDMAAQKWPADHTCWTWLVKSMLFVGCHERAREVCAQWFADEPWQKLVCSALTAHSEGHSQKALDNWLNCSALDPQWFFPRL